MHAIPSGLASLAALPLCLLVPAAATAQTPGMARPGTASLAPPGTKGRFARAPAQTTQIKTERLLLVPDLSQPAQRRMFESRGRELCGRGYALQTVPAPSELAVGTFISQSVPPGSRVTCATVVSISLASPQQPVPAGLRNSGTVGDAPVRPSQFAVGDLTDPAARGLLRRRSQALCNAPARVDQRERRSADTPAGGYDGQSPAPNTIYTCNMALTVWRSLGRGSVEPPYPPPTKRKPITIDTLSSQVAIDHLSALVLRACGQPLSLAQEPRSAASPSGDYLDQSPAAGSIYECGEPVTVFVSSGPAAPSWHGAAVGAVGIALLLLLAKLAWRIIHRPVYAVRAGRARLQAGAEGTIPVEQSIGLLARPSRLRAQLLAPIEGTLVREE